MALTLLAANNAQTVLAAGISASATSITVNTGTGVLFPSPAAGVSFFKLTLVDAATGQLTEIVHVTARSGDTMTIDRAQEGTTARAWSANDIAANMMTAGTLSYILGNFQPLDATLTALAGLATGANKLPYFTGTDTAAQTDLTSVGRDIIGKADINSVLSYLGLQTTGQGSDNMLLTGPNGLIVQIFRRTITNSTTIGAAFNNPVTYPTPFPTGVWGVFCTKMTFAQINTSCEAVTNAGFTAATVPVTTVGSTTASNAVFIAFGY